MSEAITEEVIEKMAEELPKVKAKKSGPAEYVNTSTINVFTTKGRCGPGQKVRLTAKEAGQYGQLERC